MQLLSPKKLRKLQNNPQAFFKDAIDKRIYPIANQLKAIKPKKKQGYNQYFIISAVYNVEKYLNDYFESILKQRLDFKNNIHIICVDDGSTDKSAEIIKKYQSKYPNNITYLHKENGGQASARNLGLKWLKEHLGNDTAPHTNSTMQSILKAESKPNTKPIWVTFTDPDDFLDRDYFYEVDEFLEEHPKDNISMVGCNVVFYFESKKAYSDTHPLNRKFQEKQTIKTSRVLGNFIQLAVMSAFFRFDLLKTSSLTYEENLKPNFEDALFVNKFLLENIDSKSAFLKDAILYYRKRADGTSTLDNIKEAEVKQISKMGYLLLFLQEAKDTFKIIPPFIQNTVLYDLIWQIKATLNNPSKFNFHTREEREEFFLLWDKIFTLIDTQIILSFNLAGCWFYDKIGILNCFKSEYPPFQITYIDDFNPKTNQVLLRYFTPDDKDIESIRVDGQEVYADTLKIAQNDFLDRVFCYEKRLWVHIPPNASELEVFIRGQRARITFNGKQHQSLEIRHIYNKLEDSKKQLQKDLWLFMDRDTEADDNAEHLYRYIAANHPQQNIVFALRQESKDWERLQREGFNLVPFDAGKFKEALKACDKVISSHIDSYLVENLGRNTLDGKDFVFLQHGFIIHDLSEWLNTKKIRLFITSAKGEWESITRDQTHYKFSSNEVRLTGLSRHDALLKKWEEYCVNGMQKPRPKQILVMPTWRKYIVGETKQVGNIRAYNPQFLKSKYFKAWHELFTNPKLEELCKKYNVKILLSPHQNIMPYIQDFKVPSFVVFRGSEDSLQKVFMESDLMITDYTSAASEMAYLKKPVVYYQFDEEEFFEKQWRKGYFDYRKDGFGPVVTSEEELLEQLEILLQNDCKVGEPYKSNIENTFEFRDGKCCERIYQAILELDKPYERKWTLDDVLRLAKNALNHQCYKEAKERFQYILEHLEDSESITLSEDLICDYLCSARLNGDSQEALEFIATQEYENKMKFSNKLHFEIIKNYIELSDSQEVIKRLDKLKISKEDTLEFAYLKLRIYAYFGDKNQLKSIYDELRNTYNVDKRDLDLDLFVFQNELIRTLNAKTPAGGG
ncbi:CDP-glycerol glycerophosphotransferase family protein, partial [Helicobacter sp. MIT 05-5294]|uniref:CDP-glycerol glycerophosphotransferase family protein n=1 Tax=Helicobacter sp. MIT 05-5294 TaxID=1548150 RepID=UPI0010FE677B